MSRALIVAYAFPPTGGAGVQRISKMVKYLPAHGVTPSVLTVSNPSVPVTDASLTRDLPPDLDVIRARTFEPGYGAKKAAWEAAADASPSLRKQAVKTASGFVRQLMYPDVQLLWLPGATAALAKTLVTSPPDVVLISGPPFSPFLLAPLAHARSAVILDYRDEWSVIRKNYEMTGAAIGNLIGDPLEALLLKRAEMVTTATEEFRRDMLERFPFLDPSSVVAIPNGYDRDDFPADLPAPPRDEFVISYVGTVFKLMSPKGLLAAVQKLHEREPELAKLLHVRFIGRIVDSEAALFEGMERYGVERVGYVAHEEAVRSLATSHLVLVVLDDTDGVERMYPAKTFEAMAIGRPTLVLAPADSALAHLVRKHEVGDLLPPRDEEAICAYLAQKLRAWRDGDRGVPASSPVDIETFDRKNTAGRFADVMREAMRRRRDSS
ncbi:MAG: glycosyltransferase [Labilithrix sp.]|nr:glycosyltransferase [Labilithrix sp.]MCW5811266.1 glycosyltransferase [Labilithrix sp.]